MYINLQKDRIGAYRGGRLQFCLFWLLKKRFTTHRKFKYNNFSAENISLPSLKLQLVIKTKEVLPSQAEILWWKHSSNRNDLLPMLLLFLNHSIHEWLPVSGRNGQAECNRGTKARHSTVSKNRRICSWNITPVT